MEEIPSYQSLLEDPVPKMEATKGKLTSFLGNIAEVSKPKTLKPRFKKKTPAVLSEKRSRRIKECSIPEGDITDDQHSVSNEPDDQALLEDDLGEGGQHDVSRDFLKHPKKESDNASQKVMGG